MSAKKVIIEELNSISSIPLEELVSRVGYAKGTVKKHLNTLLEEGDVRVLKISGFVPKAELLVDKAEEKLGCISSENLMDANLITKKIVDDIAKPELRRNFLSGVEKHIHNNIITMKFEDLFEFISEDFLSYVAETGNGSVSVVGRLNEEIILRALKNSTLERDVDFKRTGNDSDADIIIFQATGKKDNLYIEVKSYHARERLLRGLQDIPHPSKVGIGFFRDPAEFNPSRTQTLINSGAWAVYLPEDTYEKISEEAKYMVTGKQNYFYRPIKMFVTDMVSFKESGELTDFNN